MFATYVDSQVLTLLITSCKVTITHSGTWQQCTTALHRTVIEPSPPKKGTLPKLQ